MSQAAIPSPQAGAPPAGTLPEAAPDLGELRSRIDSIDDRIHDLLMERAALAERVLAAKRQQSGHSAPLTAADCVRPAREAEIVRRLAARHAGRLDFRVVQRIFRELIAAMTRVQAPIVLAVADRPGLRSLAADQFGSLTPRQPGGSETATLRMVAEGRASFAVLPFPAEPEGDEPAWWQSLQTAGARPLRIFMALADADGVPRGCAVGPVPLEPSGDDITAVRIALGFEVSRSRLYRLMQEAGLEGEVLLGQRGQVLMVVGGFLAPEDPRLDRIAAAVESPDRPAIIGAFPRPPVLARPASSRPGQR